MCFTLRALQTKHRTLGVLGQAEKDVNVWTAIFPSLTTSVSVARLTQGFASQARYATSRTVVMLVILNAGQNAGSAPSRKALKKPVISSRPRNVLSGVMRAETVVVILENLLNAMSKSAEMMVEHLPGCSFCLFSGI